MNLTHAPLRIATGAYILNSGLSKLDVDDPTAQWIHGQATTAWPSLERFTPKDFAELLAYGEIAVGAALLAPVVSSAVAGTALTGFGVGLVGLYAKVPGMRREGSIRPTQEGLALAKDTWLVGAGATIAIQGFLSGAKRAGRKAKKKVVGAGHGAVDALPFG